MPFIRFNNKKHQHTVNFTVGYDDKHQSAPAEIIQNEFELPLSLFAGFYVRVIACVSLLLPRPKDWPNESEESQKENRPESSHKSLYMVGRHIRAPPS